MTYPGLPGILTELVQEPAHELVLQARASGRQAIGYTCSFVPEPMLSVPGLFPQRLRAPATCGTPMADTYLSSVLCSYPRALLERILDLGLAHIDGWVFVTSCDHVRRLHDNLVYLQEPSFHCMLDLPHKREESALGWYTQELHRLARRLEDHFSVSLNDVAVRHAIDVHNEHLALLRDIDALRLEDPPAISGADFHRVLIACATAPKDVLAPILLQLRSELTAYRPVSRPRARWMVLGSMIDDPTYLSVIESVGGVVVADRFCFGSMPGLAPIEQGPDPIGSLAAHALNTTQCPRMMGGYGARLSYILELVKQRRVDGVLLETMKFCDLWGVEGTALVTSLRAAGVPVLRLEREVAMGGEGQLRTRVQAFLEALGR